MKNNFSEIPSDALFANIVPIVRLIKGRIRCKHTLYDLLQVSLPEDTLVNIRCAKVCRLLIMMSAVTIYSRVKQAFSMAVM